MKNILVWSDGATPPAAQALTTSFTAVAAPWLQCPDDIDALVLDVLLASTAAPTSVDVQLLWSENGGTTAKGPWDLTQLLESGVEEHQDLVIRTLSTADGHHTLTCRGLVPGLAYQVWMRATGGTDPTALVYGTWGKTVL